MTFTAEELKIIAQALTDASNYCSDFVARYSGMGAPFALKIWETRNAEYLRLRKRVIAACPELEKS